MALATAGDLVSFALRTAGVNGVGQTPSAEDSNDGLTLLTAMVAQWARKRWLVYGLADLAIVSAGKQSYSIGPAGDFVCPRVDRLESAFVRLNGGALFNILLDGSGTPILDGSGEYISDGTPAAPPAGAVDYPLSIIQSREDYNSIGLKGLVTFPAAVFLDSGWPAGTVYVWPTPPANQYQIHLSVKTALPVYAALTDPLNLPPEYYEALIYGLANRLCMNYGQDPKPSLVGAMRQALNTIRMANTQVSQLSAASIGHRGGSGRSAGSDPAFQTGGW